MPTDSKHEPRNTSRLKLQGHISISRQKDSFEPRFMRCRIDRVCQPLQIRLTSAARFGNVVSESARFGAQVTGSDEIERNQLGFEDGSLCFKFRLLSCRCSPRITKVFRWSRTVVLPPRSGVRRGLSWSNKFEHGSAYLAPCVDFADAPDQVVAEVRTQFMRITHKEDGLQLQAPA